MKCPVALLALSLALPVAAQSPRDRLLVSVDWLAQHQNDPNVVILQVGPDSLFGVEHPAGARYVSLQMLSDPTSRETVNLVLELPTPDAARDTLRALGVNNNSRIVLVWSDEWITPTARILFTLDWAGLGDRTVVLDGGLEAWKAAGQATTSATPTITRGNVTLQPHPELVVDAAWVQAHVHDRGVRVLDGRARAFYDGVRADRNKEGHIPGAGSLPWATLVNDTTPVRWKTDAELTAVFASAGVQPGDTVVAYCHIGQYATAVILGARLLGHPVRLYDGAFQDWAQRDLPVETSSQ